MQHVLEHCIDGSNIVLFAPPPFCVSEIHSIHHIFLPLQVCHCHIEEFSRTDCRKDGGGMCSGQTTIFEISCLIYWPSDVGHAKTALPSYLHGLDKHFIFLWMLTPAVKSVTLRNGFKFRGACVEFPALSANPAAVQCGRAIPGGRAVLRPNPLITDMQSHRARPASIA